MNRQALPLQTNPKQHEEENSLNLEKGKKGKSPGSSITPDSRGAASPSQNRDAAPAVQPKEKLDELLRSAIIEGLSHFGGSNVVESLLYILELEHSVHLRNVSSELEVFRSGLEDMFGTAAYVIEERIAENFGKSIGVEQEGRTLTQLVDYAKQQIQPEQSL